MPSKIYIKGIRKERKIVNDLKDKGWIALRSAGSHSPFDVVAINRGLRKIKLIQSKGPKFPESEAKRLRDEFKWIDGIFFVAFEVI